MSVHKTIRHVLTRGGLVCFFIGFYLLTGSVTNTAQAADSRSTCISTAHCYGITRWYSGGSSSFAGAYTNISTASTNISNNGTHIFTHEMWLSENSSRCNASPYGACWLEVGYGDFRAWYGDRFYSGLFYFWAEMRLGSPGLSIHILGPVKASQIGLVQKYYIRRVNSSTYQIVAGEYAAYSTRNTLKPNAITIGEELSTTGGSALTFAQPALFTYTAWLAASGWHFFSTRGKIVVINPLVAGWVTPLPANGPTFYAAW